MRISLIVAMSENRVIGRDNDLPWHLSDDLKRFKALTMGKPILMGRKTYFSIGKPLPGRTNVVITRDRTLSIDGVTVVYGLDEAIEAAADEGAAECMIIGGAQIYDQSLALVDRIYLTEVHDTVDGDAFFPVLVPSDWREISRENRDAEGTNPSYSFVELDRIS